MGELVKALRWALAQADDAGARADRQRWQVAPEHHMSTSYFFFISLELRVTVEPRVE